MNRSALLICIIAAVISSQLFADKFRRPIASVEGEYIVALHDSVTGPEVAQLSLILSGQAQGQIFGPLLRHGVKGFVVRMNDRQAELLSQNPLVSFVEQNARLQLSSTQLLSDDSFWHLDRIDNYNTVIYNYKAYGYTYSGANVRAYVIDTGIQASHFEFDLDGLPSTPESRVESGANMVVSWGDNYPADNPCGGYADFYGPGHGTAVASVIGGRETGVAKNAILVPVKVVTCNPTMQGGSPQIYSAAVAWALDWVIEDMQARCPGGPNGIWSCATRAVVNMSVFQNANDQHLLAIENNVAAVIMNNIPVVVSANNQANQLCETSPARMGYGNECGPTHPDYGRATNRCTAGSARTITVGATEMDDSIWRCVQGSDSSQCSRDGSGFITDPGSNSGPCVSIFAPGHNLRLAHGNGFNSYRTTGTQKAGTSFSAPLVTGLAARILQQVPNASHLNVWELIRARAASRANSAAPLGDIDPDPLTFNNLLVYQSVVD